LRHEGPLPEEALPVGEEPLTPEELDKVATTMFEIEDLNTEYFGISTEENLGAMNFAYLQERYAEGQNELFKIFKQAMIDQRK
jgi:hypothetical protein